MKSKNRCQWVSKATPLEITYHDREWGVPIVSDEKLFELLVLEGAQAGLSWRTILYKRENYRQAFDNYELEKIIKYTPKKIETLMNNPGIVRNRLKINSVISNAKKFMELQNSTGSFANYLWNFVDYQPLIGQTRNVVQNDLSRKISKELQRRGFKFVGGTIMYSYLQAAGMINDHDPECFRRTTCSPKGKIKIKK